MGRRLKALERIWKQLVLRGAARLMPAPPRGGAPDWDARPYRVLYLRYDRIGDMILATGLIRAIATSHPTITLDVLASPSNAAVLQGNPHVNRVLIFDRKHKHRSGALLRDLRRQRYDAVIDGMVLEPSVTMMLLMLATGAPWRVGVGGRRNDFAYTLPVPSAGEERHHVEQSGATAAPFGVDVARADWHPEIFLGDSERAWGDARWAAEELDASGGRPVRLLVNISAAVSHRFWPDERFVAVIGRIRERMPRVHVLVVASPSEWQRAQSIAAAAGVTAVNAALREVFALVATSDVVFTPNTSISHVASAFHRPVVEMVVRGTGLFASYGNPGRALYSTDHTLRSVPWEDAAAALEDVLAEQGAGVRPQGMPR